VRDRQALTKAFHINQQALTQPIHAIDANNVHVLSKAWLAARVSLRLARLPSLQAGRGARVAYAPRLRLRQAFLRMLRSQNSKS
jgi:hypothetical protein